MNRKLRFEVLNRDSFRCRYCGGRVPDVRLEVDHIIPRSAGGPDDIDNLVTSCYDCNHGKGADLLSRVLLDIPPMPRLSKEPNLRLIGNVWHVYWREDGRQVQRSISTKKGIAKEFLNRLRERLDRQRAGLPQPHALLVDVWGFHEYNLRRRVQVGDLAPSSLLRAKDSWTAFEAWLQQEKPGTLRVSDLTPHLLHLYQIFRAGQVKAATVNTELLLVGAAFRTAVKEGRLEHSPFESLRALKEIDSTPAMRLDPKQIAALIRKCDEEILPYVLGAVYTGARRGELFNVRWEDVDLEAGVLLLENIKTRRTAKDRMRPVPIHPKLKALLAERRGFSPGPWPPIPNETLRRKFKAAIKEANLPSQTRFHDLRHAFGIALRAKGVSERDVQDLLGHRDAAMTREYSKALLDPLKCAIGQLNFGS